MPSTNYSVRFQVEQADSVHSELERVTTGVRAAGSAASEEVSRAVAKLTQLGTATSDATSQAVARFQSMAGAMSAAADGAEAMSAKQERALNSLIGRLDPAVKDVRAFESGLTSLNAGLAAGALSIEDHGRYVDLLGTRYTETGRAAAAEAAAIEAFRAGLSQTSGVAAALSAEMERLDGWTAAGRITAEEHAAGIAQLKDRMASLTATVSAANTNSRPWFMDSNVTRNWVDVVQVLAATGGDLSLAIPTIIDAADVTKYYYDQNQRAAASAANLGSAVSRAGAEIADAGPGWTGIADGAGAAAEAVNGAADSAAAAGSVLSRVNLVSAVLWGTLGLGIAAVGGLAAAWAVHDDSVSRAEASLALYGNALGATKAQLEDFAAQAAAAGSVSVASARDFESAYLSTRKIGSEAMVELIGLSRDYAAVTDQDVAQANAALAKAFADPVKAAQDLARQYGILSAASIARVQALANENRQQEAILIVSDALKARIKGMADETHSFAAAWNKVWNAVSNTFDAMGALPMAETNTAALERLYRAQTELVKAQAEAAAKFSQETGGDNVPADWVPTPSGYTDRSGAMVGAVSTAAAQASTQLEVIQRQVQQIAEEWGVAETARISAEQAAGREAAAVVTGLNPALRQIEDYDSMLAKLRAVQGKANTELDAQTGAAIAATTARVTAARDDLQAAADVGKSIDQVRANRAEQMYAAAAKMGSSARAKYIAEESTAIALLGTAATAEERATQARRAGTQVVTQAAAALSDQVQAMNLAAASALTVADAYGISAAAGMRMEAIAAACDEFPDDDGACAAFFLEIIR